jgi:hypothetical protein
VVPLGADALIGDGLERLSLAERRDLHLDPSVNADLLAAGVGLAADLLVEDGQVVVGQVEHGPHDVLAGVVDDVADAAGPVLGEDREAQPVVVQNRGLAGLEGRRLMAVMTAPLDHRAGVEVGAVREVPHAREAARPGTQSVEPS